MSRKVVLLVSTDPKFFELPDNAFQSRGCEIFTAMTGSGALEFLEANRTALAILHGVPADTQAESLAGAIGDGEVILVSEDTKASQAWVKATGIQVVSAANSAKALLKASTRILGMPERKYVSILVQVRVTRPKPTTIFGKSRDLSQTGILVETSQMLVVHDVVTVSFLVPGAERMIQASAVVMREVKRADGSRRYGLQFQSLSGEDESIVTAFLGGKLEAD